MGDHHIIRAGVKSLGDGDGQGSRIIPPEIHQDRRFGSTRTGKHRITDSRRQRGSGRLGRRDGIRRSTISSALLRTAIGGAGGCGRKRRVRGARSGLNRPHLLDRRAIRQTGLAIPGAEPEDRHDDHYHPTGHSRHRRPPTAPRIRMSMHRRRSAGGVWKDEPLLAGKARSDPAPKAVTL